MTAAGDLRTLLRFSGFRRLLAVRLWSQLADGVYQIALAAYVVFSPEKQASPSAIASAMAVLLLPYSLLGPFAGVLLDRWRRRQVLLYGNILRAFLAAATAALVLNSAPIWLFYLSALCVTAVNRFVLAGLSAALPRVVDENRLVMANSLSPTAGTLAATAGGGLAFGLRLITPGGARHAEVVVVTASAVCYLLAGISALRIGKNVLGPAPQELRPRLLDALVSITRGLVSGVRHLTARRRAAHALIVMTLLRFGYGALTVMVLMLCRYSWSSGAPTGNASTDEGLRLLAVALGASGAGFFAAAVVTPPAVARAGRFGWLALSSGATAVLLPPLALPFTPAPMFAAAFLLGLVTQAAKITADTAIQTAVDDAFRGRVFSFYDVLFNVAFVAAAGVAALILPSDGRSATLVIAASALFAGTAAATFHVKRSLEREPRRPA